jgi:hypothetical protein
MGNMGFSHFTVNEDVIKEDNDKMIEKGSKYVIHETWKVEGALHRPKVMSKNS